MNLLTLNKWDVIRVYRSDLRQPHDKFCICICPLRFWFFYVNSEPPSFRKKRQFAIDVANHELTCLTKPVSYIDTTTIIDDLPEAALAAALLPINGHHYGPIAPFLRKKIIETAQRHGVLSPVQLDAVLSD